MWAMLCTCISSKFALLHVYFHRHPTEHGCLLLLDKISFITDNPSSQSNQATPVSCWVGARDTKQKPTGILKVEIQVRI